MVESAEWLGEDDGIRVGGGGRCVREAEFVVVRLAMLGGAVGGAAGRLRGKVEADNWFVALH